MKIQHNAVVAVNYTLRVLEVADEQGEIIEETQAGNPFVFLFGGGGLIEGFETNLNGLGIGDAFDFLVTPDKGYGDYHQDHVVSLPKSAFLDEAGAFDDEMVAIGNVLPMRDSEGNQLEGLVLDVTDENVTLDFNHPLSGKMLRFNGTVQSIRPATSEEIAHGHVHGPGGHQH